MSQAVGRAGAKGPLTKHIFPPSFEPKLRGDVLLFRTDDDGQPKAIIAVLFSTNAVIIAIIIIIIIIIIDQDLGLDDYTDWVKRDGLAKEVNFA